jgi:acyl-CoA thioesterase-1
MKKTELLLLFIFTLLSAVYSKLYSQQPIRIVCVGNSITEGFGNTSEEAAWPAQANKLLGNRYAFSNCAVSGTTMFKNSNAPYWKTERYAKSESANSDYRIRNE